MERGSEIYEHTQSCSEISLVTSGEGIFYADGIEQKLEKGYIQVIPKGCIHKIIATNNSRLRYFYLGFEIIDSTNNDMSELKSFYDDKQPKIFMDDGTAYTLLSYFVNELYDKMFLRDSAFELYTKLLLIHVCRMFKNPEGALPLQAQSENKDNGSFFVIIKYIHKNIQTISRISDIAHDLNYSPTYISRVFKNNMGITLSEYIRQRKIECSLELLKKNRHKVHEIASQLNFESYVSFHRTFKRYMKCSPTDYLKMLDKYDKE